MRLHARLLALCALLILGAAPAAAQYPSKTIHLIVPFPAGGGSDFAARALAKPL